jgi:hypothetical protein
MSHDPVIMEQIAMYMVALPCPPLPILIPCSEVKKITQQKGGEAIQEMEEDEECDDEQEKAIVCSSHDVLAGLLLCAMQRNNNSLNEVRKKKQVELTKKFLDFIMMNLKDEKDRMSVEDMYEACQKFTFEYIHSFDDPNQSSPGIRIMSMDEVKNGDKVHIACCSWHKGQDIIHHSFTKSREKAHNKTVAKQDVGNSRVYSGMSYRELIEYHCVRVVNDIKETREFMNTNEERKMMMALGDKQEKEGEGVIVSCR